MYTKIKVTKITDFDLGISQVKVNAKIIKPKNEDF